jgi:regulatory protein
MAFSRARKTKQPLGEAALFEYAVRALSGRMLTVAQLKRRMKSRAEEGEAGVQAMDAVVARLKDLRYLDDTRYATDFTRLRQANEKFGKRRVQQDLMQRGVHSDVIKATVEPAYEDVKEEALAREYLDRKRMQPPKDEKETARVVRRLVRAGFSTNSIFKVLRAWKVDEVALAAELEAALMEDQEAATPSEPGEPHDE